MKYGAEKHLPTSDGYPTMTQLHPSCILNVTALKAVADCSCKRRQPLQRQFLPLPRHGGGTAGGELSGSEKLPGCTLQVELSKVDSRRDA